MPIYINREDQHNKYWQYRVEGLSVHVSWGRIGGNSDSQVKTFSNPASLHAFVDGKISEKLRKGYREASETELKKEAQTAKSLGIENKIKRLLWVDLTGKTLALLNTYDPSKYIYVEVLNSWSKEVTRLLLSRSGTWQLGITRIGYGSKAFEVSDVTAEEAARIALEQAGNHDFTEMNSEYEVLSVREKS